MISGQNFKSELSKSMVYHPESSNPMTGTVRHRSWVDAGEDVGRYLDMLLDHSPVLASAITPEGSVLFASAQHTLLEGVADTVEQLTREEDLYPIALLDSVRQIASVMEGVEQPVQELSILHKDGELHHYQLRRFQVVSGNEQSSAQGAVIYTIGIDVTDSKRADRALRDTKVQAYNASFQDPLTGLANRALLYDRLRKSLSRAKRDNSSLAVVLLDVTAFCQVNRQLGRDAGDVCLKQLARSMQRVLRDTDTIARLGSDEFAVILEKIEDMDDISSIVEKLLASLKTVDLLTNTDIQMSANVGVSLFPRHGDSVEQLLKKADIAMSQAQACGPDHLRVYQSAMEGQAANFLLLENDLLRAFEQQDLCVFYQPQFNLRTRQIIGVEALVRWKHGHRGLISPVHFIPLAEETGLIDRLGIWVLGQACQDFNRWRAQGLNLGRVAVNLSTRQLRQPAFEKYVAEVLQSTGLPAESLELELTESSAMENAVDTVSVLERLSQMGLSLSIDDFGTGYSSLAYLQRFPIKKLKIDRSFVEPLLSADAEGAIAKSIIDMAHNMRLEVLAEGVEMASQANWLLSNGCELVQGYYFCRPMTEKQLMQLVSDSEKICRLETGECVLL